MRDYPDDKTEKAASGSMPKELESDETIAADEFIQGMRQLTAAVNVIVASDGIESAGLTATAVCSVSADPPQLLICVNSSHRSRQLIDKTRCFSVNVLTKDQEDIARRFGGMDGADRSERFALGEWVTLETGAPVLKDAMVSFDCRVAQQITVGTHTVFVGNVADIVVPGNTNPLIYGSGKFIGMDLGN